ncbi:MULTISPECIES: hypothetical protein [unclassified Pseudoalteromonas]|uniref:hypothetical protein n=1 Tax=unclassified Pseudoalteromonas TaxID=194690 RepID=UPI003014AC95
MKKVIIPVLATLFVVGCEATTAELYQKDRKPEERTEYSGIEGLTQQQKDQNYLMRKELQDKCDNAKVNLAIAKSEGQTQAIEQHQEEVKDYCI